MVRKCQLLLLVVLLFTQQAFLKKLTQKHQEKSDQKILELRKMAQESENAVIEFKNPEQYNKYINRAPREYEIVIFYTANSCNLCDQMEEEFRKVSEFYLASGHLYETEKSSGEAQKPVFFAKTVFGEQWKQVFMELEYKSVPNLLVSLNGSVDLSGKAKLNFLKPSKWQITQTDGHVTSHKMLEYINQRTKADVQFITPLSEKLSMLFIFIAIVGTLLFLAFKCTSLIQNPTVWFVGSLIVYGICSSGFIYNILHNIPMMGGPKGDEWYTTSQRTQFQLEGYVMSASIIFAGLLLIALVKIPQIFASGLLQRLVYISVFMGIFIVVRFIEEIYAKKGWYNPFFQPPAHYIKGSYRLDQGNSI